jgi:hypothetical protein
MPDSIIDSEANRGFYIVEARIALPGSDFALRIGGHGNVVGPITSYTSVIGGFALNNGNFYLAANNSIRPLKSGDNEIIPRYCPRELLLENLTKLPNVKIGSILHRMKSSMTIIPGDIDLRDIINSMLELVES